MLSDSGGPDDPETSFHLLQRAQSGDREALDQLMARYLPRLRRWASGRLPRYARDLADTTDLVQNVLLQTFRRIETVQAGRDGGLQAYLRKCVKNAIVDEIRRTQNRPPLDPLESAHPDAGRSPLEQALAREDIERYERALESLRPLDREAIVARIELGCSYAEVATMLGSPSANAARKVVERAIKHLVERMRLEHGDSRRQAPPDES